ncbi:MAG: DUF3631 domain-containing protein [Burkholderiales bacterium]|nr:DUF3631 domain-containing protein [Burkholderiales bacterium]
MNAPFGMSETEIQAALAYIPAHERDTWVRMAMAVKAELGDAGMVLWEAWSQTADNYQPKAALAVWKGIKPGGRVTIASLFHEAKEHGYRPDKPYTPPTADQRAAIAAERQAASQEAEAIAQQQRAVAKAKAAALWAKAGPVSASHPYLVAKGIKPEGAKQLRAMLMLPLRVGGELVSAQYIGADGRKTFQTGGQVKGASLVLGKLQGATEAVLCEGWATGCSLREATGLPVVVAFNAGNLVPVAERLAQALPDLVLIVAGDCDASGTGQQAAQKAAQAHGKARWCIPSFDGVASASHSASDFNDLHQLADLDAVRAQLGQAMPPDVPAIDAPASAAAEFVPPASDADAYIRYLARLSLLEYGQQRKAAGEALGVPLSILDKLRAAAVKDLEAEAEASGAGVSVLFDDVEPWPTPVDGAALLGDAYALLARYVIADRETLQAATLWSALTWFADYATVLPLALITAPEKGCGKSTLLSALAKLASRPLLASNVTAAALFRAIEHWRPSLFIDEADTFMRDNPELTGVINSGHTRDTAYVIRTVGDEHEPRVFNTWGAKAISGIGAKGLSEALVSRSIILSMRRKLAGESADSLRHADRAAFYEVKRRLARWAGDHGDTFATMRPTMDGLHNRTADNWEPLLAIADLAGGDWPKLARHAALKLTGGMDDAPTLNEELLGDIKAAFERMRVDRVATVALLDELCRDEESAWATYNRGKPVTARQLSKRLGEFGVKPMSIRVGHDVAKGYRLDQFEDAFSRYLGNKEDLAVTRLQASQDEAFGVTDAGVCNGYGARSVTSDANRDVGCNRVTDHAPAKDVFDDEADVVEVLL